MLSNRLNLRCLSLFFVVVGASGVSRGDTAANPRCSDVYRTTAGVYKATEKEIHRKALRGLIDGPAYIAKGVAHYGLNEIRKMIDRHLGPADGHDHPQTADSGVRRAAPGSDEATLGLLLTSLAPTGLITTVLFKHRQKDANFIAENLEIVDETTWEAVDEETQLPNPWEELRVKLNTHHEVFHYKSGEAKYVSKKEFVRALYELNANGALCPEGAVYSLDAVKSILRGRALNQNYAIPFQTQAKSLWFQATLLEQFKHPALYSNHTVEARMAKTRADADVAELYKGTRRL